MADRDELLRAAIERKTDPLYMTSKAQIWEYFLDQNGQDKKAAASAAARALSGESKGNAYRYARRNFEGKRLGQQGDTSKWKAFGKDLPSIGRKLRGNEITLTVKGKQDQYSGRKGHRHQSGTADRTIEVTFTGLDAQAFIDDPTYVSIWEGYDVDPDIFEDGEYAVDVYAVA